MPRFLIEVPHGPDRVACAQAVRIFLASGSHFLSHADWGCKDDDHRAWLIVEAEDKRRARQVVPPAYRSAARLVRLARFHLDAASDRISASDS